jgi:hypothetical protein
MTNDRCPVAKWTAGVINLSFVICHLSFRTSLQASSETPETKRPAIRRPFSNLSVPLLRGRGWFTLLRLNNPEDELVDFDMHLDGFAGLDVPAQ